VTIPLSPKTQARRVQISHAPGGGRTISGSTAGQGEAPGGSTGGDAG
jgi:HSP20 family protein